MLASNVLTLIDTLMLGRLGPDSLAAVQIGIQILALLFATVLGLGTAVQAITSRRMGEGISHQVSVAVHAGILLCALVGTVIAIAGYFAAPAVIDQFHTSPEVSRQALPYLRMMVVMIPALGINASFRGYFNGIGRSKVYLTSLLVIIVTNIFLNWVFIFGNLGAPALGTYGAGIASVIAYYLGNLVYLLQAIKLGRPYGFGKTKPTWQVIKRLTELAMPTMFNQLLMGLNSTVYFMIIASMGTRELAATSIVWRLGFVLVLPAFGFGMAGATLVGQALGRKDKEDARNWGWDSIKVSAVVMMVLGMPLVLVPHLVARAFVDDVATAEMAAIPLFMLGLTMCINGGTWVFTQMLNGAGDTKFVLYMSSGYNWFIGLPLIAVTALVFKASLTAIWAVQISNFFVVFVCMALRWSSGKWAHRDI